MLQETDIVKRKYDIENNTGLTWEVTRVYEDREGNTIIRMAIYEKDGEGIYLGEVK